MSGFSAVSTIPGYAVITGVEVYIDNITPGAAASAGNMFETWDVDVSLFKNGTTPTALGGTRTFRVSTENGNSTAAGADFVLGGDDDLWGNTSLSLDDIKSSNFGISLKSTCTVTPGANSGSGTSSHQFVIDRLRVKVYYRKQFTRYYFWNGSNDVQANMLTYRVTSGDLALGTGVGVAQFADVDNVGVSTRDYISVGRRRRGRHLSRYCYGGYSTRTAGKDRLGRERE
jgi:hypothetical protein